MKRRNFSIALTAGVVAAVVLGQRELRRIGSQFLQSLIAWHQTRARLNERQKQMDAAKKDLQAIVQAELSHIEKTGKFATLDELVSNGDLGREMVGRYGYVYSIHLEENGITASAYPRPGQQLPALYNNIFGPGIAPILARLHENR